MTIKDTASTVAQLSVTGTLSSAYPSCCRCTLETELTNDVIDRATAYLLLRTNERMTMVDSSPWKLSTVATSTQSFMLTWLISGALNALLPTVRMTTVDELYRLKLCVYIVSWCSEVCS